MPPEGVRCRLAGMSSMNPVSATIDVCALARVTSERLLAELLGADDGRAASHWLRGQSFIESGPRGVFHTTSCAKC